MINVLPISSRIRSRIEKHNLRKLFEKQLALLLQNPKHPSLHIELLEPKWRGLYSFRIDRKYRAIFFFRSDRQTIEIVAITVHYR